MTNVSDDSETARQKRIEAMIEEARFVAAANREKARREQEKFGTGDQG